VPETARGIGRKIQAAMRLARKSSSQAAILRFRQKLCLSAAFITLSRRVVEVNRFSSAPFPPRLHRILTHPTDPVHGIDELVNAIARACLRP